MSDRNIDVQVVNEEEQFLVGNVLIMTMIMIMMLLLLKKEKK